MAVDLLASVMEEKLKKILAYIKENQQIAIKNDDKALLEHLNQVNKILKESINPSDERIDPDKIYEAVHYIETIKIQKKSGLLGFFDSSTGGNLAELLAENGETILRASELKRQTDTFAAPLASKHHEIFGAIHKSLWENFSSELSSGILKAWSFSYPKNEKGEVINDAIGEWQSNVMKLSENPNKAFLDFHRNIGIDGKSAKTLEHMDYLVGKLVAMADYPKEDQAILIQWLKSNGGQDNNRFVDLLLMSQEFTPELATNFSSISTKQNWTLREGKIVFECDVTNYALGIEGNPYVNKNTKTLEEPTKTTIDELIEFKKDIKQGAQKTGILPMLRFKADVELYINDEKRVEPRIVKLDVTSYNEQLTSPERLYKAEEAHEDRKEEGPRMS